MKKIVPVLILGLFLPLFANAFSLGIVTDIHAGGQKKRKMTELNVIYPNKYTKFLKKLVKEKPDYILTLGDNTNKSETKYAKKVKKLIPNAMFTRGNHDGPKSFAVFSSESYYYRDIENWRIVVLYTSPESLACGTIDEAQMDWLKNTLNTDRKILVSMHIPIFNEAGQFCTSPLKEVFEKYQVKFVYSGHTHFWEKTLEENGVTYNALRALSLRKGSGYYKIINL
jgi:predicted phosphodiesterase